MKAHCNLLWLFCDQLRWHSLSANGDPNVRTPNIDRLMAEGVGFDCAVSTCPVCTPARGTAMNGRYGHSTGVRYLGDLLAPDQRTIAHAFRGAGYRTSYVGKWHLASAQNPIGHNEGAEYWVHPLLRGGFEDWFGFELSNHFWKTRYCTGDSMWPPKLIDGYQTDGLTDLALDYLAGTAASLDRPWFHVLSVEAPHHGKDDKGVERVQVGDRSHARHPAPPEYEARFSPESVTLRGNVPEEAEAVARSQQAQYCAQVENLDDNVGRVLSWLDESGLAETTLVVFTSDHGEMGGSHGRFQKGNPYEESVRIPMVLRLPGVLPDGRRVAEPACLADLLPTCASLCGVDLAQPVDGIDLAPLALGHDSGTGREGVLMQWFGNPRYNAEGDPGAQWRGLRTRSHTYAIYDTGWGQLFDNDTDPLQMDNLYGKPEHADLAERLHAALLTEMARVGDNTFPPIQTTD